MSCPSDDQLIHFAAGLLTEVVREQIRAHTEACEDCAKRISWFQEELFDDCDDDLEREVSRTRSLASLDSVQDGRDPDLLSASEDSFDFSMLGPSQHSESMGRLGKYEIRGVVGEGAMGIVLKAFEESLQRTVAIKVLKRQLCTSERARQRFIREARAAAGINHPNVVTIFAVEEQNAAPYLVMEFVNGGTLRQYIRSNGPLAPMEVVRLAKGIAEGLAAAHRQGVMHRDIKPGNILLEQGAVRVKITDFGLARVAVDNVDLTSHGLAVGTPAYMSPEQVTGTRLDHRTDLFSLGCVIHAMVAGRPPFRGTNQFDIARRILEEEPAPLDQLVEGTPQLLVEVTRRLLAKNPDDRFASADELADELGRCLSRLNEAPTGEMSGIMRQARLSSQADRPAQAKPASAVKRRILPIVSGIVIVLLLIGAATAIWRNGRDEGQQGPDKGPPPVPHVVVVGDPETDPSYVATIIEALWRAGPYSIIRVRPGEYAETIVIDSRLAGLVIEGESLDGERPKLLGAATSEATAVIKIREVSHVTLRGLDIEPNRKRGIVIEGSCENVLIEDVFCRQPPSGGPPAVDINASATVEGAGPITLRDSIFECPGPGHCVHLSNRVSLQTIVLENNLFLGRGVLVSADLTLVDVVIRGNVFATPREPAAEGAVVPRVTVGLNLDVTRPESVKRILVHNNTFLDMQHWLGLVTSVTGTRKTIALRNNLILNSESIQSGTTAIDEIANRWIFADNWWELASGSEGFHPEFWDRFAVIKGEIQVLDRDDPTSNDFVRPPPDSPLRNAAIDDSGVFDYVGAKSPAEPKLSTDDSRDPPSNDQDDRSATP